MLNLGQYYVGQNMLCEEEGVDIVKDDFEQIFLVWRNSASAHRKPSHDNAWQGVF